MWRRGVSWWWTNTIQNTTKLLYAGPHHSKVLIVGDRIKSVEQNYNWVIYRLCFENYQNKNEIINTETVDQIILDSDADCCCKKFCLWFIMNMT
jgi:hypothetical protein